MQYSFPTDDQCRRIKRQQLFKDSNHLWNASKMNATEHIGPVMSMLREYNQANENEPWYDKKKGLTAQEFAHLYNNDHQFLPKIGAVAKKWQEQLYEIGVELSFKESLDWCFVRIFYDTVCGFKREKEVMDKMLKKGRSVRFSDDESDRLYGVDLMEFDGDKLVAAYQIKPKSYWKAEQKKKNFTQHDYFNVNVRFKKFFEKFGVSPIIIYN